MRRIYLMLAVFLTFTIIFSGCQNNEVTDEENEIDDAVTNSSYEEIVQASNDFGFQVLEELAGDKDNLFISPVSLYMALSMVYPSTIDETKAEMETLLQLEGAKLDDMKAANAELFEKLQNSNSDEITLQIANSLWLDDKFQLKEDYAETIEKDFHGEISTIDSTSDASVEEMNKWVRIKTEDKLSEIIEAPLAEDFVAMLFNVVYFNGKWQHPFDKANTEKDTFYGANSAEKEVDFMHLRADLDYIETDQYKGVRLPYGDEGDMSMYALIPTDSHDISAIHGAFVDKGMDVILEDAKEQKGVVTLPKFELEYEQSLNDVLQNLGMKSAFDQNKAQLPEMITGDDILHISEVKQMTYLDINEAGTEAAAATNVGIETTSANIEEPFELTFDHPFVILIVDEATDTVLFIGDIYDVS